MKTEDTSSLVSAQGDKYQLKFHAAGAGNAAGEKAPTSDRRLFHSPIIKFSTMLVRFVHKRFLSKKKLSIILSGRLLQTSVPSIC